MQAWDLARGVVLTTLMCASTCQKLALTLDANLIASGHYDGSLRFWDCRSGRLAHEVTSLHPRAHICGLSMGGLGGELCQLFDCAPKKVWGRSPATATAMAMKLGAPLGRQVPRLQ